MHSVNSVSFPVGLVACEGCGVGGVGGVGGDDSVFITYLLSEPLVCKGSVPPTARWNLDTSSYS